MKKTMFALSMLVSSMCLAQTIDIPVWYTRYKQLRHNAHHFKDKYDVITMRLLYAVGRCDNRECLVAAHKVWNPAMDHIAKAYVYAQQMENIVVKFCVNEAALPYCITMLRDDMKYGSYKGYKGYILKHISNARDIMNARKSLDVAPIDKAAGTDI